MTPEEKSLLERTHKLTEENNEILRSMRRMSRITAALRIGYWVIIILLAFGAYYLIQPYVSAAFRILNGEERGAAANSTTSAAIESRIAPYKDMLESLK